MWLERVRLSISNCAGEWTLHSTFPNVSSAILHWSLQEQRQQKCIPLSSHASISNPCIVQMGVFEIQRLLPWGCMGRGGGCVLLFHFKMFIFFFHLLNFAFCSMKPIVCLGLPVGILCLHLGPLGTRPTTGRALSYIASGMWSYCPAWCLVDLGPLGDQSFSVCESDGDLRNEPTADITCPLVSIPPTPTLLSSSYA